MYEEGAEEKWCGGKEMINVEEDVTIKVDIMR
jgi:hypothetical protein